MDSQIIDSLTKTTFEEQEPSETPSDESVASPDARSVHHNVEAAPTLGTSDGAFVTTKKDLLDLPGEIVRPILTFFVHGTTIS